MDSRRCQATNQAGQPCSAQHYADGWCRWHHPDLDGERRAWSAKGGAARSNRARARKDLPAPPLTAAEIRSYLGIVFRGVISGKIEPGVGSAAATIARALLDVARVAEIEAQVAQMRQDMSAFAERRSAS